MKLRRIEILSVITGIQCFSVLLIVVAIFTPGWWRLEFYRTSVDLQNKITVSQNTRKSDLDDMKNKVSEEIPGLITIGYSVFYAKMCSSMVCVSLEFTEICAEYGNICSGPPSYSSILAVSIFCLMTIIIGIIVSVLFNMLLISRMEGCVIHPSIYRAGKIGIISILFGVIFSIILTSLMEQEKELTREYMFDSPNIIHIREFSPYSLVIMIFGMIAALPCLVIQYCLIIKFERGVDMSSTGIVMEAYKPKEYSRLKD